MSTTSHEKRLVDPESGRLWRSFSPCPPVDMLNGVAKATDPRYPSYAAQCKFKLDQNLFFGINDPKNGILSWAEFCEWWELASSEIKDSLVTLWRRGFRRYLKRELGYSLIPKSEKVPAKR